MTHNKQKTKNYVVKEIKKKKLFIDIYKRKV